MPDLPSVTIVFLVHNRREELRESLERMTSKSDYDPERVEVTVVDNASTDGSGEMVRRDFPDARLISHESNVGISGWNAGLEAARGDYILALDDDCYLPPDGLRRAVEAAQEYGADLVSFRVVSTHDTDYDFTDTYLPGLLSFWGCAVLIRREVVEEIGGYDPEIFVYGNETEFILRFFDRGFRHLYLPDVSARHMKAPRVVGPVDWRPYRLTVRHFAYTCAKLLRRRDAAAVFVAIVARSLLDAVALSPRAAGAVPEAVLGFVRGIRRRSPLRNLEISRFYRHNFETWASPWALALPLRQLIRVGPAELAARPFRGKRHGLLSGRKTQYLADRARWYPAERGVLGF